MFIVRHQREEAFLLIPLRLSFKYFLYVFFSFFDVFIL
jgi:hypothetical protein